MLTNRKQVIIFQFIGQEWYSGIETIGSLTWIGAGAVIRENLVIGLNVMIGAGSVIVKNIPDNAFALGVPGRIIKYQNVADI